MHTIKTGVCSVTFRQLPPRELVGLVRQSGLDAIEWGGDVHVPPGCLETASSVRKMTEDAGLEPSSYGSYWKAEGSFDPVLETALALGSDTVRVWAGTKPSDAVSAREREAIVAALRGALDLAQKHGVKLALEFHANTLSDSNSSTLGLLDEIGHPNLSTYWQPVYWLSDVDYREEGLRLLAGRVQNLHVFHWKFFPGAGSWGDSTDRRPLEEGADEWLRYLKEPLSPDRTHYALMEFVRGDDPGQFLQDAEALKKYIRAASGSEGIPMRPDSQEP